MTSIDHLMPAVDDKIRCADHARNIAIDPGGTAIRADRVVLIETGLPWPKPVFGHPTLREIDPLFKQAARPTRLLACQRRSADSVAPTRVWVIDRLAVGARERRFDVASPDQLLDLCICLAAEVEANEPTSPLATAPGYDGLMSEPAVLVCTQGSHDVCCGSDGARFAMEVEGEVEGTSARQDGDGGVRVFRVSHTGGHRFSPTAMTLPDGRMWAYMGPALHNQIMTGTGELGETELASYCRGWWGADRGPAQMAERAVFAQIGLGLDQMARTVHEVEPLTFVVETDDKRQWMVDVEVLREVPSIACREPGGLPAKTAKEYRALIRPDSLESAASI